MEQKGEFQAAQPVAQAQKKSSGLVLVVVFLALCTLVLGGLYCYEIFVAKNNDSAIADTTNGKKCVSDDAEDAIEKQESGDINDIEDKNAELVRTGLVRVFNYGDFYLVKSGEVYFRPNKNEITQGMLKFKMSYDADAEKALGEKGTWTIKTDDLREGFAFWEQESFSFEGYKLDLTNIVSLGEMGFGQSFDGYYVWFVDANGDLSTLSIANDMRSGVIKDQVRTDFKKNIVKGKNLVAVLSGLSNGDGGYAAGISRNGSIVELDPETVINSKLWQ